MFSLVQLKSKVSMVACSHAFANGYNLRALEIVTRVSPPYFCVFNLLSTVLEKTVHPQHPQCFYYINIQEPLFDVRTRSNILRCVTGVFC